MAGTTEPVFRPLPSGVRGYRTPRCARCWMPVRVCICEFIVPVETRTRIVIVMPWKESGRSSNTGRLACQMLPNCEVRLRGEPGRDLDLDDLAGLPGRRLLLFPTPDALELTPPEADDWPQTLVVPDGTWRQARRVTKFEPALCAYQRVRLPPGGPSVYRLRRPRKPDWLCTYEAIARALQVLEADRLEDRLLPVFEAMVRRTLRWRGRSVGGR